MMNYFAELKKPLLRGLRYGGMKARQLRGFVVYLLVRFLIDLIRDLPSSKLRRYSDSDFTQCFSELRSSASPALLRNDTAFQS